MESMIIAASLLAANFARLADEVRRAERAGADWLHLDVMDGHFVPNLTIGPAIVRSLRPLTKMPFDVHLMCSRPEILIEPFARAGANTLTVHVELGDRVSGLLWQIRSAGAKVGLAINPPTPMDCVKGFLNQIDLLLVMTVNPGFGGQAFIQECVPKIQRAQAWRLERQRHFRLEVDGGINAQTVGECTAAGADTIVSGTSLFGPSNMPAAVRKIRRLAEAHARLVEPVPPKVRAGVETSFPLPKAVKK
jgi:ribulose-phosphate 3-epimerase